MAHDDHRVSVDWDTAPMLEFCQKVHDTTPEGAEALMDATSDLELIQVLAGCQKMALQAIDLGASLRSYLAVARGIVIQGQGPLLRGGLSDAARLRKLLAELNAPLDKANDM